jgi:hypothetical protein
MKILCVIQDNTYLSWQVELLRFNCKEQNTEVQILIGWRTCPTKYALYLQEICGAILIEDTREHLEYSPSIQPHILSKYTKTCDAEPVLLVDSDILIKDVTKLPEPKELTVIASDCHGYISATYVDSCDTHLLKQLCCIAGIPVEYVRSKKSSAGAQYIFPNLLGSDFWERVEVNSVAMYNLMQRYKCDWHPVQIWTASMWSILFELYKYEINGLITVETNKELDFCWATDSIHSYNSTNILHMAGVTQGLPGFFFKGDYVYKVPFGLSMDHVKGINCSSIYAKACKEFKSGYKENQWPHQ